MYEDCLLIGEQEMERKMTKREYTKEQVMQKITEKQRTKSIELVRSEKLIERKRVSYNCHIFENI